jgi:hypothetical protein
VYNRLTEAIKKRLILELRRFWSYDPNYRDELVKHIQGRYAFRERPQLGIIVKGGASSPVQLSADNFQGTISAYAYLQKVGNHPGLAVEWVTDDHRTIASIGGGIMPSPRGVYYIAIEQEEVDIGGQPQNRLVFYVDPLLEIVDETPMQMDALTWQLANTEVHPGSLRIYELPGNIKLYEGANYTVDYTTGEIILTEPLPGGVWLSADYRTPGVSTGPFLIRENHTNVKAIPGVVLAFGRRVEGGDRVSVVVQDRRSPVALEYGGRWELNFDLDVMARDVVAQGEICDKTMIYLWGVARNRLSEEGIEITTVNFSGEAEEIYDDNGDDYFYTGSISLTLQSDWAIHVPLGPTIERITPQTVAQATAAANLADDALVAEEEGGLQVVEDINLLQSVDPFFRGRNRHYEVIK